MRSGSNTTRSACAPSTTRPRSRSPSRRAGTSVRRRTASSRVKRPAVAHEVTQHHGRVVGVAHDVEVRAGVGATEHDPVVAPHLAPDPPALVRHAERRDERGEHGRERQTLGEHDVEQHVDGIGAALGGDGGDAPAVGQLDELPLHHRARTRVRRAVSNPARSRSRTEGSRNARRRSVVGEREDLAPARERAEDATAPHAQEVGERERDDRGALRRGEVARGELLLVDLGRREAAEQVPVERAVGGQRHVGHQLGPRPTGSRPWRR